MDRDSKITFAICSGLAALGMAALLWAAMSEARAHHVPGTDGLVYERGCCNSAATHPTGDCAPIDDQYVSERSDGYHVDIPVGGHPKLKDRGYAAVIPYRDKAIRNPLDNRFHICLATNGHHLFCFHPKPGMS